MGRPNGKEKSPVPIYFFLLSFANDYHDSIPVRVRYSISTSRAIIRDSITRMDIPDA